MTRANYAMKLDGANNVRDLGGYPTKNGKITKWKQFLRSDNPSNLSDYDCENLYMYGVRLQIDLRSDFECAQQSSKLNGYPGVEYINIQLQDNMNSNMGDMKLPDSMYEVYIALLDEAKPKFKVLFEKILEYPNDCVMFNCTGGKDRTGTTAMLLLLIANCVDEYIVSDYAATFNNLRRESQASMKMFEERGLKISPAMMASDPEVMQDTLKYFYDKYQTIENWLNQIGLTEDQINALKKKIVE